LIASLGREGAIVAAQRAIIEMAVRNRLYVVTTWTVS
jgi:hypothetical protein